MTTLPPSNLNCPTCLAPIDPGAETCVKCGAPIADPASAEAMGLLGELTRALEGRYNIGDVIGAGRGGITTYATQAGSNREVAIKVAWNEAHARTQVLRETVLTGKVQHPRVLPMRDIQAPESMLVVEMQLAVGGNVGDLLNEGRPVPYKRVLEIVRGVAGALDAGHAAGIIHGGLRPVKILLDAEGQPLLTDFEIRVPRRADWDVTRPSEVGAQAYMPLEQRHDSPTIDGRVDQYALAIIAYELLRGQTTWRINHEGVLEIDALDILVHRPIAPDAPLSASTAIKRATAKDPTFRYSSVNAFLQAFAGEASESTAVEHMYRDQSGVVKPKRSLMWLSVPATLALLLIAMQPTVRESATNYWERNWGSGKKGGDGDGPDVPTIGTTQPISPPGSPQSGQRAPSGAPSNTTVGATTPVGGTGGTVRTSDVRPQAPNTAPPRTIATIDPSATGSDSAKGGSKGGSSRSGGSSLPRPDVVGGDVSKGGSSSTTPEDTRPGTIVITLNADARAAVIVDGKPRGLTPVTVSVPAGKHTVSLGGAGTYSPASSTVQVAPGDTVRTTFGLSRKP